MSQRTRKEVLGKLRRRYRKAGLEHKRKLLDQAQELLGYHRKSAVRVLGGVEVERVPWVNAGRPVSYKPSQLVPWLRPIWQATDYACGRRLVAMLPEWIPAYEQHERRVPAEVREKLLEASARTLDRLVTRTRQPPVRGRHWSSSVADSQLSKTSNRGSGLRQAAVTSSASSHSMERPRNRGVCSPWTRTASSGWRASRSRTWAGSAS